MNKSDKKHIEEFAKKVGISVEGATRGFIKLNEAHMKIQEAIEIWMEAWINAKMPEIIDKATKEEK